ncbi:CGNR zinc finger domain-containing protein [Solicola sp. PLA-1-18]|uniref:CGNR zinc finger domain-containing protein n=1 Tax=Solicola sp. PLA-1-18 TaxID=3380532 RepID=UPI003B772B66
MVLANDARTSLQAAATLANTMLEPDTLTTVEDVDDFYRRFGYSGRLDLDRDELDAVRDLRARLRDLLLADHETAVRTVNALLAESAALPQLVCHDDSGWHVHAVGPDAPLATRIAVETAMAMIDVIRADELSRLAVCADDDCDGVVVDLSRNRSRRYCSTTCTNRNAVAAFRARQGATDA